MWLSALLAFALILSVSVATPGPTVLLVMSNGSRYGLRHVMVGMLGAVTTDVSCSSRWSGSALACCSTRRRRRS